MARWDIAEWVGPTGNRNAGGMTENRGLIIHIMQGSYAGSIAWGKNPASNVSFHFATRGDGHIGQLVDTVDAAWTQGAGNGHWLSVENEGFSGNALTPAQVDACARLYARGVREHGWPYQLADSPSGRGLGWHGMGGAAWGGHPDCPGAPIVAQLPAILARAAQINGGGALSPPGREGDDDMTKLINVNNPARPDHGSVFKLYPTDLGMAYEPLPGELGPAVALWGTQVDVADPGVFGRPIAELRAEWAAMGGGGGGSDGAATPAQVRAAVRTELDATRLAGPAV